MRLAARLNRDHAGRYLVVNLSGTTYEAWTWMGLSVFLVDFDLLVELMLYTSPNSRFPRYHSGHDGIDCWWWCCCCKDGDDNDISVDAANTRAVFRTARLLRGPNLQNPVSSISPSFSHTVQLDSSQGFRLFLSIGEGFLPQRGKQLLGLLVLGRQDHHSINNRVTVSIILIVLTIISAIIILLLRVGATIVITLVGSVPIATTIRR